MNSAHLELVSFKTCPFVQRAAIVLLEKAVPFEITYIDQTKKPDWFVKISPLGKVPLLKVNDTVLFESAVMKTSVISQEFRHRYLERPGDPEAFEGRAIVFEGPEDYHARINDPALGIDADCILFIRHTGPVGYPGAAEVVNMLPPDDLVRQGITLLPCVGDGRQSGTSGSPSILNASPEAAVGGGLALLRTGDRVRIDLGRRRADMLISDEEYARRKAAWTAPELVNQTPWQELYRRHVTQLQEGGCLDFAINYQRIDATHGIPRDNH